MSVGKSRADVGTSCTSSQPSLVGGRAASTISGLEMAKGEWVWSWAHGFGSNTMSLKTGADIAARLLDPWQVRVRLSACC